MKPIHEERAKPEVKHMDRNASHSQSEAHSRYASQKEDQTNELIRDWKGERKDLEEAFDLISDKLVAAETEIRRLQHLLFRKPKRQ